MPLLGIIVSWFITPEPANRRAKRGRRLVVNKVEPAIIPCGSSPVT
jgi:hypothetical protein